jgi:hypothetical protein
MRKPQVLNAGRQGPTSFKVFFTPQGTERAWEDRLIPAMQARPC